MTRLATTSYVWPTAAQQTSGNGSSTRQDSTALSNLSRTELVAFARHGRAAQCWLALLGCREHVNVPCCHTAGV